MRESRRTDIITTLNIHTSDIARSTWQVVACRPFNKQHQREASICQWLGGFFSIWFFDSIFISSPNWPNSPKYLNSAVPRVPTVNTQDSRLNTVQQQSYSCDVIECVIHISAHSSRLIVEFYGTVGKQADPIHMAVAPVLRATRGVTNTNDSTTMVCHMNMNELSENVRSRNLLLFSTDRADASVSPQFHSKNVYSILIEFDSLNDCRRRSLMLPQRMCVCEH